MAKIAYFFILASIGALVLGKSKHINKHNGNEVQGTVEAIAYPASNMPSNRLFEHGTALAQVPIAQHEFEYTLGTPSPDYVNIYHDIKTYSYIQLSDVTLKIDIRNKLIKYIKIHVYQDSNQGESYVEFGGIDREYIQIKIKAFSVFSVDYIIDIYGPNP